MGSEHLSSYEVIYEEDTALYDLLQAGKVNADEDLACAMYEELVDCATTAGFQQYEVANFARAGTLNPQPSTLNLPTHACRHNINYWRGGSFVRTGSQRDQLRPRRAHQDRVQHAALLRAA